jgi:hypothetical protein
MESQEIDRLTVLARDIVLPDWPKGNRKVGEVSLDDPADKALVALFTVAQEKLEGVKQYWSS